MRRCNALLHARVLVAAKALLDTNANPSETEIRYWAGRQPVPLHGLRQDRARGPGRRRRDPRGSLGEADMPDGGTALSPETVMREIRRAGVSHVVWLPDSETNWLYLLMKAEPGLSLVGSARGHACSIAGRLGVGRRRAPDPDQNTG